MHERGRPRSRVERHVGGWAFGAALALAAACTSSSSKHAGPTAQTGGSTASGGASSSGAGGGSAGATEFSASSPAVYVAKVKNLLVGLAPTDDELTQVTQDPTELKGLITTWMQEPEYQAKMLRFFQLAFQQTQVSETDFSDQAYPRRLIPNSTLALPMAENAEESFARTMLELIADGRPLTDAMTTRKFMLTTAMKEIYAFLDAWEVDDDGKVTDAFKKLNPKLQIYAEAAAGPIAIADSLDPTSSNYMHFYDPDVTTADANVSGCTLDPIVYPANASTLHILLWGSLDGWKTPDGTSCPIFGGSATAGQLTSDDFSDWTMVTIRAPKSGEAVTPFYDLPTLRTSQELVLTVPRVGFFSTPAFFANWQTNISNQMRVTLNQALIVALGASVDGTDTTVTPGDPPPGLDEAHAGSPDCRFCHQTLDPLRSIFSATYSWNYHNQLDPTWTSQPGLFAFQGVTTSVSDMADFGSTLAAHPLFASAWVQKLCYYANSAPCSSDDPEFQRVVSVFQNSSFSFATLVTELFSSPLVTGAAETKTLDDTGEVIAVSRRDHLCAALDNRLGLSDVCGLYAVTKKARAALIPSIAAGLPSDGYGRGSVAPVLPNQPTLFYRAGLENICGAVAAEVIDVPAAKQVAGVKQWTSSDPNTAIADFVTLLMALPASDPRSASATTILTSHFTSAQGAGQSASNALKSTFVTACLSPSFISLGL
jgi:hypothetical protein